MQSDSDFSNHTAKYLLLNTYCAQNVRFFNDYLSEIREMFRFSGFVRKSIEQVNSGQFLIFGDDENFKAALATKLGRAAGVQGKRAYISAYNEFEEMYISSQLCSSFLISNAMSTFGWWLAFFSKNQDSVYYTNDQRDSVLMEGVQREDLFLYVLFIDLPVLQ
ncbi:hypothetical protein ANCDUO_03382 [Ancylostoma duodenale]|uniref:Uncharacterized protein n=1 Tax=Ancylostoma duodenale TaxID=51022 RepID=A0A0C2GXN1_9BILA|nr:hypothetical protein ANCDUO_03382 [Ancylostoma duodenale]